MVSVFEVKRKYRFTGSWGILTKRNCLQQATLFFFCTMIPGGAAADDRPTESAALMERALQRQDVRAAGGPAFEMQASVNIKERRGTYPGRYQLIWESEHRWREELVLQGFERLRIGTEEGYQQVRNLDYQLRPVFDLDQGMQIAKLLHTEDRERLGKIRERKINGSKLSCVEVKNEKGNFARELCFEGATGNLVHAELPGNSSPSSTERTSIDYRGFQESAEKHFPMEIRVQKGSEYTVSVTVSGFSALHGLDEAMLVPSGHGDSWGDCAGLRSLELENRVQPQYPSSARRAYKQGVVTIYAAVEADGALSYAKVIESAGSELDEAALSAVKQWRYHAPTCNGKRVRTEIPVTVIFSLQY
jgi:TonB family protein